MADVQNVSGRVERSVPFQQGAVRQQAERQQDVRQQRQGTPRDTININKPAERQIARAQNRNETVIEQRIQQGATPRERGGVPQDKQQGNIDLFA
ncbi:hypothetical protein HY605_00500 [Candidatus Peregrinibacteria bacterium]|nr:hypothetical protein [Candidatus Peregrinibacteria bacterium]